MSDTPCSFDDCPNLAERGGLCWAHVDQQRKDGRLTAIMKRPTSARERLTEAAIRYANAPDDDEDEFRKADDNLRKSATAYALREADRGGRPRKVEPLNVVKLVEELGGTRKAAEVLQVTMRTVQRALSQYHRALRKS